jgi:KUP system potassium uptake protein
MRHSRALGTEELPHRPEAPQGGYLATLTMAALGIVYGDIGTSPLYSVREVFLPEHGVLPTPENVLGVLSLVVWSLLIIISVKYLGFVLRADNQGEGGILALAALVTPGENSDRTHRNLLLLGLFGTALVYGDGMITPAISVLSAVEGLEVATPWFTPYIQPITIAIIIGLFLLQKHGTAKVGRVFGPVTLLWFVTLAVLGIANIRLAPGVLTALNPLHALWFFVANGWHGFVVLGSVFLVVTGGEALYADMGHFGPKPIRLAWFAVVLPALLLCYFGQGALIMSDPSAVANPFYRMAPAWALYPLVALATAATVFASQALISGAFSLTRQAVQLGYAPRTRIAHTSASEIGQIYIPGINWGLMLACIALVIGFRTSSNLAAAYGLAVTTTMVVTALLFFFVAREQWRWPLWKAATITGFFLVFDLAFWGANLLKIPHGGWFPLVIGAGIFTLLTTWKRGRAILAERLNSQSSPLDDFLVGLKAHPPQRVIGTAVFMYSQPKYVPPALLLNLTHNNVLHHRVILLSVTTKKVPTVAAEDRARVTVIGDGIYQVMLRYGFMDNVDVPAALIALDQPGLTIDPATLTYFLGRETVLASDKPGMALWREHLFGMMTRNARSASSYFRLPPGRVVELGAQVEI